MFEVLASGVLATAFTTYPGFGDSKPRIPRTPMKVEAVMDRGPILELIIKCPSGSAIISYSKVERVYCSPRHKCHRDGGHMARMACGI